MTSPKEAGFFMPAEWTPHAHCWMAWPCREEVWGAGFSEAMKTQAAVANAVAEFEPLTMLVPPGRGEEAKALLGPQIEIWEVPIDDSWARDSGPNFLIDGAGGLAAACWSFNAWGGKYDPYDQDALMGRRIAERAGARVFASDLVAEGGGISVDGEGTVLTTRQCFPNKNRNPGWSEEEIAAELCATLGAEKVVWLAGDPDDQETDGHVDGIAAFVEPGVVLLEYNAEEGSRRNAASKKNLAALEGQTDAKGRPLEIVKIEEADQEVKRGERFSISYINAYLANGAVIMAGYGIAADDRARGVYAELFPGRKVVQVPIADVAVGGGGIHCITQQQPKV